MTPDTLRATLRTDLVAAMKGRRAEAVSALRTAIAAIDNAEAVDVSDGPTALIGEHVAGAVDGLGSTEAERRVLTLADVRALLGEQVGERDAEADRYDGYGRPEEAARLRAEADVLRTYLA